MIKKLFILFCILNIRILADPFSSRDLMIFLDNSEKAEEGKVFFAITAMLNDALASGSSPILCTSMLLHSICKGAEVVEDCLNLDEVTFKTKYKDFPLFHQQENDDNKFYHLVRAILKQQELAFEELAKRAKPLSVKDLNDVNKIYGNYFNTIEKPAIDDRLIWDFLQVYSYKAKMFENNIDNDLKWIVFKISNFFYLLIPRNYINALASYVPGTSKSAALTPIEYYLGLKISHFDFIQPADRLKSSTYQKDCDNCLAANFDVDLSTIFVTNADYAKQKNIPAPKWVFYWSGHGSPQFPQTEPLVGGTIASVTSKIFDFFNTKIITSLLFLRSCYGAGTNLEIVNKNTETQKQKQYSFTLISGAITETPVHTIGRLFSAAPPFLDAQGINLKTGLMRFISYYNYSLFFKMLREEGPIDFVKVVETINPSSFGFSSNIPIIRLPGLEWMQVLAAPEKVVSIGRALSEARDPDKTLDISTFFGGKNKKIFPEALLLYAHDIKFPLKISKVPRSAKFSIISMIPGNAAHFIKKIDAESFTFSEIIKSFFPFKDLFPTKIFLIDELQLKNDLDWPIKVPKEVITLKNVAIINHASEPNVSYSLELTNLIDGIFFTHQNQSFKIYLAPNQGPFIQSTLTIEPTSEKYAPYWIQKMGKMGWQPAQEKEKVKEFGKRHVEEQERRKKMPLLEDLLQKLLQDLQSLAAV